MTFRKRLIIAVSGLLILLMILLFFINSKIIVNCIFIIALFKVIVIDRASYYKPSVAFIIPWAVLYLFQEINISVYNRDLDFLTWKLMAVPVVLAAIIAPEYFSSKGSDVEESQISVNSKMFGYSLIICYFLFFANVIYSGYIPLIQLLKTGDSDYMDYGIKGINGLFYAYSNAFGVLCFYLYLETKSKSYLFYLGSIFLIFIICITRQNLISLIFEIVLVYTIKVKPLNIQKGMLYLVFIIWGFSAVGDLRSGDIKDLVGLKTQFIWLPASFIWIYSYGFFNVLNLDNLVHSGSFGMFNGSSFATLLPSFLRPEYGAADFSLEVSNFTVSSYINPVFYDVGYYGLYVFTLIVVVYTVIYYKRAISNKTFKTLSIYAVLAFCAFFSFFVNFWFYLPIIFQIPFLLIFNKKIFKIKLAD